MRPVSELPAGKIRGVFSDLDDTLTEDSRLSASTLDSLEKLKSAGFWLVIVSGRPAGWADCLMRLGPFDAMLFENGAGLMVRDGKKIRTVTLAEEKNTKPRLEKIFQEIKLKIPKLKLATDQSYRLCDFAIDFAEEPEFLTEKELDLVLSELGKNSEITAKLSSIHVNYWWGTHTKVTACEWLLANEGKSRGIEKNQIVYSGDSPNDEPLFEFFPNSVGVANIQHFIPRMKTLPKFVTASAGGEGFQELALKLLETRTF